MGTDADNKNEETGKDESAGKQPEKKGYKNKKKKKAVHFSNLTVEEVYSKFDIDSNIFPLRLLYQLF